MTVEPDAKLELHRTLDVAPLTELVSLFHPRDEVGGSGLPVDRAADERESAHALRVLERRLEHDPAAK